MLRLHKFAMQRRLATEQHESQGQRTLIVSNILVQAAVSSAAIAGDNATREN